MALDLAQEIKVSEPEILLATVPQRYPLLMVDKILEHDFRKRALCLKNITLGEEIFTGHFENNPIYPGVLMVEMGLQTTQVMLSDIEKVKQKLVRVKAGVGADKENTKAPQGFLVTIEKFKYYTPVVPGDCLMVESILEIEAMGLAKCRIEIKKHDGVKVADGKVSVTVSEAVKNEVSV